MKGDFSRLPFPPAAASGVYLQQGRVLLDADWNAQLAIQQQRLAQALGDLAGSAGAPEGAAGFAITPRYALALNGPNTAPQWLSTGAPPWSSTPTLTLEANLRPTDGAGVVLDWPGVLTLSLAAADGGLTPQLQPAAGGPPIGDGRVLDAERFAALAIVVDGAVYSLYLDGEAMGSGVAAPPQGIEPAPAADLTLAAAGDGAGGHALACQLAGARVWTLARRPADIRETAFARLAGDEAGLYADLVFEPGPAGGASRGATLSGPAASYAVCDVWIGAGRYYLDGLVCHNPRTVAYSGQPLAPPPPDFQSDGWLFYLDVWERLVTALQDPPLRDPALGGPDTSGWTFVSWRVGALSGSSAARAAQWSALLTAEAHRGALSLQRPNPLASTLENTLYRVEVQDSGVAAADTPDAAARAAAITVQIDAEGGVSAPAGGDPGLFAPGRPLWVWREAPGGIVTACRAQAAASPSGGPALGGLSADLQSAGPALVAPLASFKWSSVNGCVAFPIVSCTLETGGQTLQVILGSEGDNGFALEVSDWVELTDDRRELGGPPGLLRQVISIDRAALVVRLSNPSGAPTPDLPSDQHPLMRRWDAPLAADGQSAGPALRTVDTPAWIDLDAGIQVAFAPGGYRSGDYWTFTARDVAGGVIAWPNGAPSPQPPQGIDHGYAQLAVVQPDSAGPPQVSDTRPRFAPLIKPPPSWAAVAGAATPPLPAAAALFDAPQLTLIDGESKAVWRRRVPDGDWTRGPDLPTARPQGAFGRLGYDLFALGGRGSGAERMDVLAPTGGWRRAHALPRPVVSPGVGASGTALYVFGGLEGGRGRAAGFIQQVDAEGAQLLPVSLITPRAGARVAEVDGRLFVIGGEVDGQSSSAVEGFDPRSRSCRPCAPLAAGVSALAAVGWRGLAAVLGRASDALVLVTYDPAVDAWRDLPPPPPGAIGLFVDGAALYAVTVQPMGDAPGGLFRLA